MVKKFFCNYCKPKAFSKEKNEAMTRQMIRKHLSEVHMVVNDLSDKYYSEEWK